MNNFKSLYDNATPIKVNSTSRLVSIMTKDGKPTGCIKSETTNDPFEKIRTLLEVKDPSGRQDIMPLADIYRLYDAFVYCNVLKPGEDVFLYICALSWFTGNIAKDIKYVLDFTHTTEWTEALGVLKGTQPKTNDREIELGMAKQQLDRANAVSTLIKKFGIDYRFDNHYRLLLDKEEDVAYAVASMMADFGGAEFLKQFLQNFEYVPSEDRLFIPRQSATGLPQGHKPEVPLNYLLNLAIGHLMSDGTATKGPNEKSFDEIIYWASTYCLAYYEAQTYSIWNLISHKECTIIENWMRLTFKDGLNYFRQTSPRFILDYCNYIIDCAIRDNVANPLPFTLDDLRAAYNRLSGITDPYNVISFEKAKLVDMPNADAVLDMISIPIADVNAGFEIAADYEKVTYWEAPVIKVDDGNYLLLPSTIGASCWYDKLTAILRTHSAKGIDFQEWLGTTIQEGYVKAKFASKGIGIKTGKYKVQWKSSEPAEEGEADFIVEGKKFKLLIESKTKSFTRKALSGYDVCILMDLVQGLYCSQTQAFRTAATLHCKKHIDLCDDQWNVTDATDYMGEKMEKVTLTYGDYGFFQDRLIIDLILKDICTNDFNIDLDIIPEDIIPADRRKGVRNGFKKLVEEQEKMNRYLSEMGNVDKKLVRQPFFDCWHLNLEQLVYLISLSHDEESFYAELMKSKNTSTTTLDFWNERYNIEFMRKGANM